MTTRLRVGMGDRYGVRFVVPRNADFDPSSVTAAALKVTKPGGPADDVTWPAAIVAQDGDSVTVAYVFSAAGTDLDVAGNWKAWIQWEQPSFTIGPRTEVGTFPVAEANAP